MMGVEYEHGFRGAAGLSSAIRAIEDVLSRKDVARDEDVLAMKNARGASIMN